MIVGARQRNRLISRAPSKTAPTANATGNPAPINGAGAAPQTAVAQGRAARASPGLMAMINAVTPLRFIIRCPYRIRSDSGARNAKRRSRGPSVNLTVGGSEVYPVVGILDVIIRFIAKAVGNSRMKASAASLPISAAEVIAAVNEQLNFTASSCASRREA
jgi:hypothetical protein